MNQDDFSNLGKQIGEAIEDAIGAVSEIACDINKNVKEQLQSVKQEIKKPVKPKEPVRRELPVTKKPTGKVSGILMLVFGSIGAVAFGLLSLIVMAGGILTADSFMVGFTVFMLLPLFAVGFVCAVIGMGRQSRVGRFQSYVRLLREKHYCSVKKLAAAVGKTENAVLRDLSAMMRQCWFLEGHLDEQKTCFMATDEVYRQYQQAQEAWRQRQLENAAGSREDEDRQVERERDSQLETAIREGNGYIRQIRRANEGIPGQEISQKLDRLETVISRIYDYLSDHPDKLPEMRRFMEYYLPTTLKLVNAYAEFNSQPVQGENIRKAKQEIEASLDKINFAFENMFDQLFQEDVLDISSDISALSAMLAQEGLMGSEFTKKETTDGWMNN